MKMYTPAGIHFECDVTVNYEPQRATAQWLELDIVLAEPRFHTLKRLSVHSIIKNYTNTWQILSSD